ncbi:LacI family DNA-binding transcriptional regulator [Novosphingobium aquae]|uniref:LacI family DNA-binding transcriptional regulator n=1 Tax=Novosphingobium aquae TaxID=3133435 RepID=A0ABU8SA56_9SPHN
MKSKQATIYEVAAAAGVAIKTVSRVINDETGVSAATREKVREAVRQLSYRPNRDARNLASSRSHFLALVFDEAASQFVIDIEHGIASAAGEQRHVIVEAVTGSRLAVVEAVEALLTTSRPDCLILLPPVADNAPLIQRLDSRGVRYARLSTRLLGNSSCQVLLDDADAAQKMVQYLVSLGHREIGFIRDKEGPETEDLRLHGYKAGLRNAGISFDPSLVEHGNGSFASGAYAASLLSSNRARPTAVFAASDEMALGVLSFAGRKGLSIPDQLSVCSFGNSNLTQLVWPPLTTVGFSYSLIAQTAVRRLLTVAEYIGDEVPAPSRFAAEITPGGTTASPAPGS